MKRLLVFVLAAVHLALFPMSAIATERTATQLLNIATIVNQLRESSEASNSDVTIYYDQSMDALVLLFDFEITDEAWVSMQKDITRAKEGLSNFCEIAQSIDDMLGGYDLDDLDAYLAAYTSEGSTMYVNINGNDITEMVVK